MSGRTVKRKSPNARQAAGAQAKARRVKATRARTRSLLGEVMAGAAAYRANTNPSMATESSSNVAGSGTCCCGVQLVFAVGPLEVPSEKYAEQLPE